MARKHEHARAEHCVSTTMFQEYIAAARLPAGHFCCPVLCGAAKFSPSLCSFFFDPDSENDLEEVLTLYTQKNKSSSVFLGTRRSVKRSFREGNASSNCENSNSESSSSAPLALARARPLFEPRRRDESGIIKGGRHLCSKRGTALNLNAVGPRR